MSGNRPIATLVALRQIVRFRGVAGTDDAIHRADLRALRRLSRSHDSSTYLRAALATSIVWFIRVD